MPTVDQSNPFPFNGMIAFSAPGQLGDHYLRADGSTIVDPVEYPLVTTILDPTIPDILAVGYSSDLALYVCADGGNGSTDDTIKPLGFWWSTDGANWNLGTSYASLGHAQGSEVRVLQIVFDNGIYVAVGTETIINTKAVIYTSTDGKAWTLAKKTSGTGDSFQGVAFGNDLWIAVGETTPTATWDYVSTDNGATWAVGNFSVASTSSNSIAFSPTLNLFAIASGGGTPTGKVYTSADDAVWTARTIDTAVSTTSMIWDTDNAKFITIGDDTKVYVSTNGTAWTGTSYTTATAIVKIRYNATANLYIAISDGKIYSSTNTTAWTLRYTPTGSVSIEDIIGEPFFAGLDTPVQFASSANGTTWVENTGPGVTAFVSPYIGFRDINDDTFNAGIYIKLK